MKNFINAMDREGRGFTSFSRSFLGQVLKSLRLALLMGLKYGNSCGKTANNRINQLHKRALRVLQNDYTATFEDLLEKSEEATVHCSNLQKLMIEIYQCTNHIGPAVLTEFFTTKEIIYDLRIKNLLQIPKVKTSSYGQSSLSFRGSIL